MLTIQNIHKIEGYQFDTKAGQRNWVVGMLDENNTEYTFAVFEVVNGIAAISSNVVFKLRRERWNRRGYPMLNNLNNELVFVKSENLHLINFELELAIQTARLTNNR